MTHLSRTSSATVVIEPRETVAHAAPLDLVVPFTTPELTRAALDAANSLSAGLGAEIRLVKVQLVPYPLELTQSPVPVPFLEKQLSGFRTGIPARCEVCLAREFEPGLTRLLHGDSVVVLASLKRPWRTHTENLALWLRRAGYRVLIVSGNRSSKPCPT